MNAAKHKYAPCDVTDEQIATDLVSELTIASDDGDVGMIVKCWAQSGSNIDLIGINYEGGWSPLVRACHAEQRVAVQVRFWNFCTHSI